MKKTKATTNIAISSVVVALSVVVLFLANIFPMATYVACAFAGALNVILVIDISKKHALMSYIAVCILTFLISGDLESKVLYATFFGYYPILKAVIEQKIFSKIFGLIAKLIVFNVSIVCSYIIMIFIFKLPVDSFEIWGFNLPIILLIGFNVVFIFYDIALSQFIRAYIQKFRGIIFQKLKF